MAAAPALDDPADPGESTTRQLSEALQELRVAMPGVQLLFGFLLIVPFNSGFDEAGSTQIALYTAALISAALSSACFITPAAYHRLVFQQRQRARVIGVAQRAITVGLGFLAISLTASVALATGEVLPGWLAVALTLIVGATLGGLWFGVGLLRRREIHDGDAADGPTGTRSR